MPAHLGTRRPRRRPLALAGFVLVTSLLGGGAAGARDLAEPAPAPLRAIVVHRDGATTRATVTELMPGVGGELELVDEAGRVADHATLHGAGPVELTAEAATSYRLRFRQQASSSDGTVSLSGLAMAASDPFPLAAAEAVVAELRAPG